MSYINDPREMAIRPESGVTLEQDNRIETMYHWGAMVTDLCDMPVEEYMKPMTVIGLGGGGETPDTGTTIYTLKFMIDGVVVAQESLASGDPIPFSVNAEKENRTFLGWYYGSTAYTEGALMPSKNLTLSAKYECNVSFVFVVEGNEEIVSAYSVSYNTKLSNVPSTNKPGYKFISWEPNTASTIVEHTVFKATFEPIIYIVTWSGYTDGVLTQEYRYKDKLIQPINPEKEGYTFAGWDKDIPKEVISNLSFNAKFTINQYEVIFKTNDDEVITIAYSDYGTPIVDILPKIEGKTYVVSDDVLNSTVPAENMVIYGDLIVNDYEVTFIVNGNEEKVVKLPYESSVDNYVVENFIPEKGYSLNYEPMNVTVPSNNNLVVNITYVLNKETPIYFGSYVIPTSAYSDDNISKYYDESQLNTSYYDSIMVTECVGNGSLIIIFMPGYEPFANLSDRNAAKEAKNYYQPPVFIVPINVVDKYNINVIDGVGGDQWPNFITDKATLTINGDDYYFYSRIPNDTLTPGKYDNSDLKVTLKLTEK